MDVQLVSGDQKIGRDQHVIGAVVRAAGAAQYKTAVARGNDLPETRRRPSTVRTALELVMDPPGFEITSAVISAVGRLHIADVQQLVAGCAARLATESIQIGPVFLPLDK